MVTIAKENISYLTLLLYAQIMLEKLDDVKGTVKYKQSIKNTLKNTSAILERELKKDLNSIFNSDEELTQNFHRILQELIEKLSTYNIDDLFLINKVIDKYKENQYWWHKNGVEEFHKLDV